MMGFLNELAAPFELRNVTTHPEYARELEAKSGKCISPSLDIDGQIFADANVEQVAKLLKEKGIVVGAIVSISLFILGRRMAATTYICSDCGNLMTKSQNLSYVRSTPYVIALVLVRRDHVV